MPNQPQDDRFKTYDQQIDILKNQKNLMIAEEDVANEALVNIGYFTIIKRRLT